MRSANKFFINFIALAVGSLIVVFFIVGSVLSRAPDISKESPSGQYLIESVPAGSLLTPRDSVYLRFTDLSEPDEVYRTPLFSDLEVDMNADEDETMVGIVFITFDKPSKEFKIALSNHRESFLNFFVSNTPYVHLENN